MKPLKLYIWDFRVPFVIFDGNSKLTYTASTLASPLWPTDDEEYFQKLLDCGKIKYIKDFKDITELRNYGKEHYPEDFI